VVFVVDKYNVAGTVAVVFAVAGTVAGIAVVVDKYYVAGIAVAAVFVAAGIAVAAVYIDIGIVPAVYAVAEYVGVVFGGAEGLIVAFDSIAVVGV